MSNFRIINSHSPGSKWLLNILDVKNEIRVWNSYESYTERPWALQQPMGYSTYSSLLCWQEGKFRDLHMASTTTITLTLYWRASKCFLAVPPMYLYCILFWHRNMSHVFVSQWVHLRKDINCQWNCKFTRLVLIQNIFFRIFLYQLGVGCEYFLFFWA